MIHIDSVSVRRSIAWLIILVMASHTSSNYGGPYSLLTWKFRHKRLLGRQHTASDSKLGRTNKIMNELLEKGRFMSA